jgi:hypothetical protein
LKLINQMSDGQTKDGESLKKSLEEEKNAHNKLKK